MGQPPGRLDGEASWHWLDGPDQYRWAGLRVLVEAYPPTGRASDLRPPPALTVSGSDLDPQERRPWR
ncbi:MULTISPECIES: hypothetical protein [Streptosporangium]|uniref:Uncharacterized protein n=1 Tax=Streptosporangium brasiliense TaxID=47480 RepID=A0ABT9RKQ5_9ACTN|nr:hypothetical protein [Streptosporangium brasiliense]MDP9868850.1 hypothetical protein [Streptosporangium brasiliense]